jgi:hypothetical protein
MVRSTWAETVEVPPVADLYIRKPYGYYFSLP